VDEDEAEYDVVDIGVISAGEVDGVFLFYISGHL
jgi:hypothetical protein